jgi:ornithine cyclodeaminase/alanine dehydrogenase-like protein (mu-crystallin family)
MLCLSEKDLLEAVTPDEIIGAVTDAMTLTETGDCLLPDRMHVEQDGNTLLLMPSFAGGSFGTKLVSVFPGNRDKNVPVVIGTMVLNNGETGEPLAIMNGTVLTALRTGAVGAVGIKYLTPASLKTAGVLGAGVQGVNQALFCTYVRDLKDVFIYDPDNTRVEEAVQKLSHQRPGVNFHPSQSAEELIDLSGAIIAATTASQPVLPDNEELLAGKTYVGIGSFRPQMREFPRALFNLVEQIFVDTHHAASESGDLLVPLENGWIKKDQIQTIGKYITDGAPALEAETQFFKSVGMALFDLLTAQLIYKRALEKGLGHEVIL